MIGLIGSLFNLDRTMTDIMERLPTELMVEVVGLLDRPTIHSFTIVSSKYREIAQPLLFRRIYIESISCKRLALFIEQVENSSKHASMIKILMIVWPFTPELLDHLFTVISNLEELFIYYAVANPTLLPSPHYFPKLRRLHFPVSRPEVINYLVANFIPCHRVLDDLKVTFLPHILNSDPATRCMPTLAESVSIGVNRLVTYHGPSGLLPLLTPNSRMEHLTSTHQLDEGALRKLSSAISGGLLSLIIGDPMDPTKSKTLPGPLIPSLFPNLRSLAWLSLDINSVSVIDQLPCLRRIWFSSMDTLKLHDRVAFVSKIQELSDNKNRPLQEIWVYARAGHPFSLRYSKASIDSPWMLKTDLPVV